MKMLKKILKKLRYKYLVKTNHPIAQFNLAIAEKKFLKAYTIYKSGGVKTTNYRLALCYESSGNLVKTRYYLKRIKFKSYRHWLKLAEIEVRLNYIERAENILRIKLNGENENLDLKLKLRTIKLNLAILYSRGEYNELLSKIDDYLASNTEEKIRKFLLSHKINILVEMRKFSCAERDIEIIKQDFVFDVNLYQVLIRYYFQANSQDMLELYTKLFIKDHPNSPQAVVFRIKCLWGKSEYDKIYDVISHANKSTLMTPAISKLCASYSSTSDVFLHLENKIKHWAAEDVKKKKISASLLYILLDVGKHQLARRVFNEIQNISDYESLYLQGVIHKNFDEYKSAVNCFKKCILINHSNLKAYSEMYECLNYCMQDKIHLYLSLRNKFVNQYSKKLPDGMNKTVDNETFQYLFASGKHSSAYDLKQERPLNRSIRREFPHQVLTGNESVKDLSNKKVLIIAEEGVGDELRMSEFYKYVKKYNISATITCEPRLYNIFENNFKYIEFIPLRRQWEQIPISQELKSDNSLVPCRVLSKYMDDYTYQRVKDFDVICMLNEYISLVWKSHPLESRKESFIKKPDDFNQNQRTFSDKKKVGILWSSSLKTNIRNRHYLSIDDYVPIFEEFPQIEFVSLSSSMSDYELEVCQKYGVTVIEDIDLRNDFDSLSYILPNLDLVIGVSSFITEFAASFGIPFHLHAVSPIAMYFRGGVGYEMSNKDVLTSNSVLITPNNYNQNTNRIRSDIIKKQKMRLNEMFH